MNLKNKEKRKIEMHLELKNLIAKLHNFAFNKKNQ